MEVWQQIVLTVFSSVLASSGLWAYITKRLEKKDVKTEMLVGLAHDRILFLGMHYVDRGFITQDEYENLHDYLYVPYEKMEEINRYALDKIQCMAKYKEIMEN